MARRRAELTALEEQYEALHARSERAKFQVMVQIRALLTPEQLDRVARTHRRMKDLDAQLRALEPTIAGEKREPSSLVQATTSIGASVS